MKIKKLMSLLFAALLLFGLAAVPSGAAAGQGSGIDGAAFLAGLEALGKQSAEGTRLVVKTTSDMALSDDFGASAKVEGYNGWHVLQYASKTAADSAYAKLSKLNGVKYVERSQSVSLINPIINTDDTAAGEEAEPMSWGAAVVKSPEMKAALAGRELPETVIAILDTGLDFNHPYFIENADRITGRFKDGRYTQDDHGHGTHVAGIICDNAPGNVKISPYKVLNGGGYGDDIYIATAMCAAADDKVDVISMSLGGPRGYAMDDAVVYAVSKGVTVVVAAGNWSEDVVYSSPAGVPQAITVSATNKDNTPAYFSNYGALVDIAAPGGYASNNEDMNAINSTTPIFRGSYYQKWAGTSMATPFVSAAAATVKALHPDYTPGDIENALKRTAVKTQNWDARYGAGVLNCKALLDLPDKPLPDESEEQTASFFEVLWQWILRIFFFGWIWM